MRHAGQRRAPPGPPGRAGAHRRLALQQPLAAKAGRLHQGRIAGFRVQRQEAEGRASHAGEHIQRLVGGDQHRRDQLSCTPRVVEQGRLGEQSGATGQGVDEGACAAAGAQAVALAHQPRRVGLGEEPPQRVEGGQGEVAALPADMLQAREEQSDAGGPGVEVQAQRPEFVVAHAGQELGRDPGRRAIRGPDRPPPDLLADPPRLRQQVAGIGGFMGDFGVRGRVRRVRIVLVGR